MLYHHHGWLPVDILFLCSGHCRYLQEYSALGTGGGIYHFRDQIVSGSPEAFFVLNADVSSAFPLTEMLSFQKEHGEPNSFVILGTTVSSWCGLLVHVCETARKALWKWTLHLGGGLFCSASRLYWMICYLMSEREMYMCFTIWPLLCYQANRTQSMNYGCIVENEETHEVFKCSRFKIPESSLLSLFWNLNHAPFPLQVLHYVEKPSTFVSDIINCGVYLFSPDIFQHIGAVFQKNQQDMLLWVGHAPSREHRLLHFLWSSSSSLFFFLPLSSLPWFVPPHTLIRYPYDG